MRDTYLWLLQLVTGGLIIIFLGVHLVLMHLDNILGFFGVDIGQPSSWSSMIERATKGWWLAFYIIFLALVLYHALYGLRGVILEVTPSGRTERIVTGFIWALGIVAFGLGVYAPTELFIG